MGFDFDAAVSVPFRMQPGLRRLADGVPWLTPSVVPQRGTARHLREKLAVFGAFAHQALLADTAFDARPALQALAEHAAAEHPGALVVDGGQWRAAWLGWSVNAQGQPEADTSPAWPEIGPLLAGLPTHWRHAALLSLAFAEDFAIVDATSGRIPWLAVALPSGWAPEDKVGRHFTEVHAPVADNRLLITASDHLLRLVASGERWERFVWTVSADRRLHAHPARQTSPRWPAGLTAETIASVAWWRTERQTFLPLPALGQVVFTITVMTTSLAQALPDPALAARVHDALASMSDAVLAYRSLAEVRAPLLGWLAQQAGG